MHFSDKLYNKLKRILYPKNEYIAYTLIFIMLYCAVFIYPLMRNAALPIEGDIIFPQHPEKFLRLIFMPRSPYPDLGTNVYAGVWLNVPLLMFYYAINVIIKAFTSDPNKIFWMTTVSYIAISLLLTALAYYLFSMNLFRLLNVSNYEFFAFLSTLLYFFTPLIISDQFKSILGWTSLNKAGLFFLLATVIQYVTKGGEKLRDCLRLVIFAFLAFPSMGSILSLIFFEFILTLIVIISFINSKKKITYYISKLLIITFLVTAANLYWLLPFILNLRIFEHVAQIHRILPVLNKYASVINVMRLLHVWGFWSGFVSYKDLYTHPLIICFTFIYPLSIALGLLYINLLLHKRERVTILFIYLVYLVFIFITSLPTIIGIQEFSRIVEKSIFFRALYMPSKFTNFFLQIFTPILTAFSLGKMYSLKNKKMKIVSTIIIVLIIVTYSYPLISGDVFKNTSYLSRLNKFKVNIYGSQIPNEYYYVDALLFSLTKYRWKVLLLPPLHDYFDTVWYLGAATTFYNYFFKSPMVTFHGIPRLSGWYYKPKYAHLLYVPPTYDVKVTNFSWKPQVNTYKVRFDFSYTRYFSHDLKYWIVYNILEPRDWSTYSVAILNITCNASRLWVGIADVSGRIGMYSFYLYKESRNRVGMYVLYIDLDHPHINNFNKRHVKNLILEFRDVKLNEYKKISCKINAIELIKKRPVFIPENGRGLYYFVINETKRMVIEYRLPWAQDWSHYDVLRLQLSIPLKSGARITLGDCKGHVGGYPISYFGSESTRIIEFPLNKIPLFGDFDIRCVSSIRIELPKPVSKNIVLKGYYILKDVRLVKKDFDIERWVRILLNFHIKYILYDKSILIGQDASFLALDQYEKILDNSKYFRLIYSGKFLKVYEVTLNDSQ